MSASDVSTAPLTLQGLHPYILNLNLNLHPYILDLKPYILNTWTSKPHIWTLYMIKRTACKKVILIFVDGDTVREGGAEKELQYFLS